MLGDEEHESLDFAEDEKTTTEMGFSDWNMRLALPICFTNQAGKWCG